MNIQRILILDAAMSGAAGLAMIAGANLLGPLLNLPITLLQIAGAILIPWTAALLLLARASSVSDAALKAVISVNVLWVAASLALIFVLSPNLWGVAFVLAQAFAVGAFAALQIGALRGGQALKRL